MYISWTPGDLGTTLVPMRIRHNRFSTDCFRITFPVTLNFTFVLLHQHKPTSLYPPFACMHKVLQLIRRKTYVTYYSDKMHACCNSVSFGCCTANSPVSYCRLGTLQQSLLFSRLSDCLVHLQLMPLNLQNENNE